jgi:hypothetical protein
MTKKFGTLLGAEGRIRSFGRKSRMLFFSLFAPLVCAIVCQPHAWQVARFPPEKTEKVNRFSVELATACKPSGLCGKENRS